MRFSFHGEAEAELNQLDARILNLGPSSPAMHRNDARRGSRRNLELCDKADK
jgi:hypothetical protein